VTGREPYLPPRNLGLRGAYPVVQGYKDSVGLAGAASHEPCARRYAHRFEIAGHLENQLVGRGVVEPHRDAVRLEYVPGRARDSPSIVSRSKCAASLLATARMGSRSRAERSRIGFAALMAKGRAERAMRAFRDGV